MDYISNIFFFLISCHFVRLFIYKFSYTSTKDLKLKKTFQLKVENKNPDRLLEAIKHEIRKYIKREKRKPLPEGADFWQFDCKFAKDSNEPEVINFVDITKNIDEASNEGCESFYIELLSKKANKPVREISNEEESEIKEED